MLMIKAIIEPLCLHIMRSQTTRMSTSLIKPGLELHLHIGEALYSNMQGRGGSGSAFG